MTDNPQRNKPDMVAKNQLPNIKERSNLLERIPSAAGSRTQLILILVVIGHLLLACHQQEREFVRNPHNQVERLRDYSLPEQYKIFRYGQDHVEPPLLGLADPIAERGEAAVPFLKEQLNSSEDEIALRDILWVFERMKAMGTYDASRDPDLIRVLTARVDGIKDVVWQESCRTSLRIIIAPK